MTENTRKIISGNTNVKNAASGFRMKILVWYAVCPMNKDQVDDREDSAMGGTLITLSRPSRFS